MNSKQWLALKASAGSGKTFALSMRYVSLLLRGANPNEILTLTFTKKAALEMSKRIQKNLLELKNDRNAQALKDELARYGITAASIRENIDKVYQKFLDSNTKITTIDAFLNSILKKFCWYAGVSHGFQVEFEDKNAIFEDFLSSLCQKDFKRFLDFCVDVSISPQVILDLIAQLNAQHFKIDDHLYKPTNSPTQADILHTATTIKNYISGLENASASAKEAIKNESFKTLLESKLSWLKEDYRFFKKLDLTPIAHTIQEFKNMFQEYFDAQEYAIFSELAYFLKQYKQRRKISTSTLSFEAITLKTYELLQEHFERDFFYFRLDAHITHILIDEFQDTSTIQYKILKPLIDEIYAGKGRFEERSVFFVGDSKQSIYRFRGSNSELFDEVSRNIQQENLPYNYRSSSLVVDYVNEIFAPKIPNYIPQQTPPDKSTTQGYIKACPVAIGEDKNDNRERVFTAIKTHIDTLLANNISMEKIAVLCFNNADVDALKEFLLLHNPTLQILTEATSKLCMQNESKIILHAIDFAQTQLELYKKSAIKLAGLPYDTDIIMPTYTAVKSPQKFVLEVMETFGLYGKAAQQMLEASFAYDNLEDFKEGLNRSENKFSPEAQKGLLIMTIHKSKGLEFDYVLLCDRIKDPTYDRNKFFLQYQGIELKRIFYKALSAESTTREMVDPIYQEALEGENSQAATEKINVLYVAFTRAKEGLIIIYKDTEKESKSAFTSLDLKPIEYGKISTPPIAHISQPTQIPQYIQQQNFGKQVDFIKQDTPTQDFSHLDAIFGEALHQALEYKLGHHIPPHTIAQKINNQFGYYLPQKSIQRIFELIENLQKNATFQSIIRESSIKSEVSYLYRDTLNRIDGLILDANNQVIIIDYKSGIKNKEKHIEQVKKYLEFTQTQFAHNPTKAYVLYVRDPIEFIPVI
ncbi:hypothetical protein BKH46_02395 [Helicobacter sp. 12S02634-8]|uniref:RecB-like helicase n=1 Tax=Helicobacter sp. 12S02634-8 TaxID=1476199 RepID=UPI000BA7CFCC|nr:RecB-like helicase [Helicobacter sp. 12S02634-8]PAF48177.1 hypothetical protein BKH46_02395 [Helicobacter sp. 12S02634-8]